MNTVGRVGRVTMAIPGGSDAGEVTLVRGPVNPTVIAYADTSLERGTEVIVIEVLGNQTVFVAPLW